MDPIRSTSHPLLKRARALARGSERDGILLEGRRLIEDARARGLALEVVLVSADDGELAEGFGRLGIASRAVAPGLLESASSLAGPPGAIAIAGVPESVPIERLAAPPAALIAVASGVADPGNLGAIARTAEAAGAAGLVAVGGAWPWSPKCLRGSMGSLLRLPVALEPDATAVVARLSALGVRHARAATRGGADCARFDWRGKVALWLTSETGETGELTPAVAALPAVTIPMHGAAESLNVNAAAAVLLFAAARARGGAS